MTKAAVLRRQCIRAKRTLMRRWPNVYREAYFEILTEEDLGCLPGTPMFWGNTNFDGDADCCPAVQELRMQLHYESVDWGRGAEQDEIRYRFEQMIKERKSDGWAATDSREVLG